LHATGQSIKYLVEKAHVSLPRVDFRTR